MVATTLGCLGAAPGTIALSDTPGCSPTDGAVSVEVVHVVDGDTVVLGGRRHLRLIGVNAPELGHRPGAKTEPLAAEARAFVTRLLRQAERLTVVYGKERIDRHGRSLGHLFVDGNVNVQARLIARGLGFAIAVPPNLSFVDCYAAAETRAGDAGLGIWREAYFQPRRAADLSALDLGFRRIRGRIETISHTRNSVWLKLAPRVSLRIDRRDLPWFPADFLTHLRSRTVVARGWLSGTQHFRMRVHHPVELEFHLKRDYAAAALEPIDIE